MKQPTLKMPNYHKNGFINFLLHSDAAVSVLVVLLGFFVGTLLVWAVGKNPLGMYESFFQVLTGIFWNNRGEMRWEIRYVGEWINISVPYILCGLTMGFAARAGLFNIGGEGQYLVGLTTATVLAVFGPQIPVLHWVIAVVAAVAVGAIWGGIVGFLKAKFEVSEVVATIMLNYIALYLCRIIILDIPGANTYQTPPYPTTASIRWSFLDSITNTSKLNLSIFFVIIAVITYWLLMEKTNIGFGLRATGYNKDASMCSGIPVVKSIILAMGISGAFSGLAGASVALGSFEFGRVPTVLEGYGFAGIAVALVGNSTAGGTLLAGLLFGMLARAQGIMQENGIPKEITLIIQGLIVVFIAFRAGLKMYLEWQQKKDAEKKLAQHMNEAHVKESE
ncbi:MAG: ABC transporter permease [Spirochaetales bacterium]